MIALLASLCATAQAYDPEFGHDRPTVDYQFHHGFRMGYSYAHTDVLPSPHLFVMGYELQQHMKGGSWLDVILVQNFLASGINQSIFIPSANFLVGFEIDDQLQFGVGPNFQPFVPEGEFVHMVGAIGYSMRAGAFDVPIHLSVIPDVDGEYRVALTTGVNWMRQR